MKSILGFLKRWAKEIIRILSEIEKYAVPLALAALGYVLLVPFILNSVRSVCPDAGEIHTILRHIAGLAVAVAIFVVSARFFR